MSKHCVLPAAEWHGYEMKWLVIPLPQQTNVSESYINNSVNLYFKNRNNFWKSFLNYVWLETYQAMLWFSSESSILIETSKTRFYKLPAARLSWKEMESFWKKLSYKKSPTIQKNFNFFQKVKNIWIVGKTLAIIIS